ncbi:MAG: caspase family protein [Gammaproteobacteria bacterium]
MDASPTIVKMQVPLCAWVSALVCALGSGAAIASTRAVLIGINDYAAPGVSDLRGTHADVATMKSLLINEFGVEPQSVVELLDSRATRASIIATIRRELIAKSAPGDVAILYYSGHGSKLRDQSRDETDGWDETLVAQDSRLPNVYDITDDEINALLAELAGKTPNITVIFDSCHSGTAARGLSTGRRIDADPRVPPPGAVTARQTAPDGASDLITLGANFTLLSGSRASELSNEDLIDGQIQGAFTHSLAQALRSKSSASYREVFPEVAARVSARFPAQNPQLEGSGLDSRIFGLPARSGPRYLRVEPERPGRAAVAAGAMYGLAVGAELQVYPPAGDGSATAPVATLVLTEVTADAARGRLQGASTIPAGSRALVTEIPIGGRKRSIWLAADLPNSLRDGLRTMLAQHPSLVIASQVDESQANADLRVVAQGDRAAVMGRDGTILSDSVVVGSDLAAMRVVTQLEDWARWVSLLELSNPNSPYALRLTLRVADSAVGSPAPSAVSHETRVTVRLENASNASVYFSLLNLGSSGRIALLYPLPGAEEQLAPGSVFERSYRMTVPAGRGALMDVFKVIAGDAPIDGSIFQQAAVRSDNSATWNSFQRFIADRARAHSRDAEAVAVNEWVTAQASLLVTRSAPILEDLSFAVHYAEAKSTAAVEQALTGQRSLCADPTSDADCARAAPLLPGDDTVFEVRSPMLTGRRGVGSESYRSVGQAFDEAYALRDSIGADYAEPLLKVTTPVDDDTGGPGTRGGDSPPDPIAAADDIWSLRYANVLAAKQLVRDTKGRPEGSEAAGVLIAHPDTGFTQHPENWQGTTPRPVFSERGHDYVDDDDDAQDPLLDSGLLAHPGHGTASSSVIVSPPLCQLAGKTHCVSGAGAGARVIPLRVHTSVVVFDTKRLARAIMDAANGRLGGKVDAISIAMGGPPSLTLRKAVRRAERQGVLLIAAAGNYVQTVVWPARFNQAIAVSAINPRCVPWKHASHGRAVDISAPGEGVWRATFDDQSAFDIGMGAGTTFATGTTAGIAALWLAHFADDPKLEQLRSSGQLADAFRQALQATAWKPENPPSGRPPGVDCGDASRWEADEYGPGIIDARALLERPLPAVTRALEPEDSESRVPQWATLYAQRADTARIEGDYQALFGTLSMDAASRFETEVMYHYAMSADVRESIDRLVAAGAGGERLLSVRNALLSQDLSARLRTALRGA